MYIASVGRAFPEHYYDQAALLEALSRVWASRFHNPARLEQIFQNVLVGGRHLALPLEAYAELSSFGARNDVFIRSAVELGARAIQAALERAGLHPADVDHLLFVSSTGIATPSIDARLINRLNLRHDLRRTPVFGWGCLAGAAGLARLADDLRGYPDQVGVLLSVELCSLTVQLKDTSTANLISSGLFGDGAAAVVMTGATRPTAGPAVVATRSVFYPNSEAVMGWEVTGDGFQVVLTAEVPDVVTQHVRGDVDRFLAAQGLTRRDLRRYICHPGGPKVLRALEQALELPPDALAASWSSLQRLGNLSSASVLMILDDTLQTTAPAGSYDLVLAMGPGFCSELVLLRW